MAIEGDIVVRNWVIIIDVKMKLQQLKALGTGDMDLI